jgi:hypothetical protein
MPTKEQEKKRRTRRSTTKIAGKGGKPTRAGKATVKASVSASRATSLQNGRGRRVKRTERMLGDIEDRERVLIQLSRAQVDEVLTYAITQNGATDEPEPAKPTRRRRAPVETKETTDSAHWIYRTLLDDRSLSQSLLRGLLVLTCFPLDGTERGVADIAEQLGMNTSTTHRYMTTLLTVGLLERDPLTRRYRLAVG